jgi:hypothetical protein
MADKTFVWPKVSKKMIDAARMAEFRHYYGDISPSSITWRGTPIMVIKKMLEAALMAKESLHT